MNMTHLSRNIKETRLKKRMTLSDVAELANLSLGSVWASENIAENSSIKLTTVISIAKALSTTVGHLLNEEPEQSIMDKVFFNMYLKQSEDTKDKIRRILEVISE